MCSLKKTEKEKRTISVKFNTETPCCQRLGRAHKTEFTLWFKLFQTRVEITTCFVSGSLREKWSRALPTTQPQPFTSVTIKASVSLWCHRWSKKGQLNLMIHVKRRNNSFFCWWEQPTNSVLLWSYLLALNSSPSLWGTITKMFWVFDPPPMKSGIWF